MMKQSHNLILEVTPALSPTLRSVLSFIEKIASLIPLLPARRRNILSSAKAFKRLNEWRSDKTSLEVHVSLRQRVWADVWGIIREIEGTVVEVGSDAGTLRLGLRDAIFEWRDDSPSTSHFREALSAKFSDGDEVIFSVVYN